MEVNKTNYDLGRDLNDTDIFKYYHHCCEPVGITNIELLTRVILLEENLAKADDVIRFYALPRTYEVIDGLTTIDPIDHEQVTDKWGDTEWLGGKRARQYLNDKNNEV